MKTGIIDEATITIPMKLYCDLVSDAEQARFKSKQGILSLAGVLRKSGVSRGHETAGYIEANVDSILDDVFASDLTKTGTVDLLPPKFVVRGISP